MDETMKGMQGKRRFGCGQVLVIVLLTALVSAGVMFWWAQRYLYAGEMRPVALSAPEEVALQGKLELLHEAAGEEELPLAPAEDTRGMVEDQEPEAEAYVEDDEKRTISLTERELNALIAENDPEAAKNLAIDLGRDLVSLKVIMPVEEGTPFLGGKRIRLTAGLGVVHEDGRMRVVLRGISVGGIPLPSAWLGDLKGKELIQEFGDEGGFWEQFSQGIDHLEVRDGRLSLRLRE